MQAINSCENVKLALSDSFYLTFSEERERKMRARESEHALKFVKNIYKSFYNKCYERERALFYFLCLKILHDDNSAAAASEVLEDEECLVIDNEEDFTVDPMKGKFHNSELILIQHC